jgi:hypothetical protein
MITITPFVLNLNAEWQVKNSPFPPWRDPNLLGSLCDGKIPLLQRDGLFPKDGYAGRSSSLYKIRGRGNAVRLRVTKQMHLILLHLKPSPQPSPKGRNGINLRSVFFMGFSPFSKGGLRGIKGDSRS